MKIICVGRNYRAHAEELNNPVPEFPLVFMKPSTSLLVNGKPFYYPSFTEDLHYELEVVIKICKNGRHIQPEHADSYFQDVSIGIDFTARDLQSHLKKAGHPWEIAKAFDHSAVLGTFVQRKAIPEIGHLSFSLKINDRIVQVGNTRDMIFDFSAIISYVSRYFKLQSGDMIFTGTPAGVGPVHIGDHLIGYLENERLLECEIR